MMTIVQDIASALREAFVRLQKDSAVKNFSVAGIEVEIAQEEKFGDYTSNVALRYGKEAGMQPREFAEILRKEIDAFKKKNAVFSRVEVAGPGFLNFFLSEDFLRDFVRDIAQGKDLNVGLTRLDEMRGAASTKARRTYDGTVSEAHSRNDADRQTRKSYNIEFLSANPTGPIQVGNARLGFYGDVLGNVLEAAGYSVTKEYYINNAKTSNQIGELGKTALGQGSTYLTPYLEKKIKELVIKLARLRKEYEGRRSEPAFASAYSKASADKKAAAGEAGFLLANAVQKDTAHMLRVKAGIRFDAWTQEQDFYRKNLLSQTLEFLKRKKLVYEQEGALWLRTTQFGDDKDKVIVRSTGEFGYYLADIAYHSDKIARGYNTIIDVFGADHQGHVKPMEIAMKILGYKGRFAVLIGQLVQAKGGGKLSKRRGGALTLEELIDEAGIDAVRFFYLARSLDTQMEFDIDLAREQSEKNPVYYVQYTYARMCSILRKAKQSSTKRGLSPRGGTVPAMAPLTLLTDEGEVRLMRKLVHFPEIIESIAQDFQVHRLTSYTLELAQEFNQFYRDYRVLTEDAGVQAGRLMLTEASKTILARCLALLGVRAPEKM